MRSPERKGTVPSLAMSVPSKASTMSPRFSTLPAGEVGSTRCTYTPFCPACSRGAGAQQASSPQPLQSVPMAGQTRQRM